MKAMRETIRDLNLRCQTQLSLQDIARQLNPLLRGWIGYYGRYAPSALYPLLRYVNHTLVAWAMRKFKRFKGHKILAGRFFERNFLGIERLLGREVDLVELRAMPASRLKQFIERSQLPVYDQAA